MGEGKMSRETGAEKGKIGRETERQERERER